MNALGDYLQEVAVRRREIGIWDCCTFPAGWLMWCGLPDPMSEWRGAYGDGDEDTDLVSVFEDAASAAGLVEVEEPQEGDIGVVSLLGHQAGAIFTGRRWTFVAERGLAFTSLDPECVVKAWRMAHG